MVLPVCFASVGCGVQGSPIFWHGQRLGYIAGPQVQRRRRRQPLAVLSAVGAGEFSISRTPAMRRSASPSKTCSRGTKLRLPDGRERSPS